MTASQYEVNILPHEEFDGRLVSLGKYREVLGVVNEHVYMKLDSKELLSSPSFEEMLPGRQVCIFKVKD